MTSTTAPVRSGRVLATLAVAGIIASLPQTLVVPLISHLPEILDTNAAGASWVITVTLLALAVATPVLGKLADRYGKRRVILFALVPLVVGSALCALATSLPLMLVGRALQGLSTGIVPLGISLLHDVMPKEKVGSAIALMSSSLGIGGALGLPVSAAVAQFADWRTLFWAAAIAAALLIVAIAIFVPDRKGAGGRRFDYVGAVGFAAGLACLMLAISQGSTWGWASAATIGMFVAAAVILVAWGFWELRTSDPLVDLRTTAKPLVLMTNIASIMVGFAMYAQSLIIPQLMQLPVELGYGLGQSMFQMGLWMAPAGIAMMAVSPLGARITRAKGPKTTLVVGGIVMAIGYGGASLVMGSLWGLMVFSVLAGAGVGFAFGAMPALIMGAVPASEKASANAFNSLMRSLGTTVSAAVVGAVLAGLSTSIAGHTIPTEAGFRTGLLIGCGVAIVAALLAATIPVRRRAAATASATSETSVLDGAAA